MWLGLEAGGTDVDKAPRRGQGSWPTTGDAEPWAGEGVVTRWSRALGTRLCRNALPARSSDFSFALLGLVPSFSSTHFAGMSQSNRKMVFLDSTLVAAHGSMERVVSIAKLGNGGRRAARSEQRRWWGCKIEETREKSQAWLREPKDL